jgi:hypothetical protein
MRIDEYNSFKSLIARYGGAEPLEEYGISIADGCRLRSYKVPA